MPELLPRIRYMACQIRRVVASKGSLLTGSVKTWLVAVSGSATTPHARRVPTHVIYCMKGFLQAEAQEGRPGEEPWSIRVSAATNGTAAHRSACSRLLTYYNYRSDATLSASSPVGCVLCRGLCVQ